MLTFPKHIFGRKRKKTKQTFYAFLLQIRIEYTEYEYEILKNTLSFSNQEIATNWCQEGHNYGMYLTKGNIWTVTVIHFCLFVSPTWKLLQMASAVFNALVLFCIREIHPALQKMLSLKPDKDQNK